MARCIRTAQSPTASWPASPRPRTSLLGAAGGALGREQRAPASRARGVLAALAVPARPRPHRPLQGVPAAQAQDAGLHRARGRPLPHAAHAHDRGDRHLAHGRARAAPERGSDRGDRARPRPRPPALRARGRGGARPAPCARASACAFRHNEHSLRVVDHLERDGQGLNLTHEVRDGILQPHGPRRRRASLEGRIVRIVDRVAYINHDIDDALRAGVLRPDDLPAEPVRLLGATGSRRIDALVHDLVESSEVAGDIVQSPRHGRGDARAARVPVRRASTSRGGCARRRSARRFVVRTLFDHYCTRARGRGPRGRRAREARRRPDRRHDRPLRGAALPRGVRARRPGRSCEPDLRRARLEAVKERADLVELARARTELRQARDEWMRPLPVPRGALRRRSR